MIFLAGRFINQKILIFVPRAVDGWCRYTDVANEIRKGKYKYILDVGAGGEGISKFLDLENKFICVLDIKNVFTFMNKDKINPIIGDGCNLPFKAKTFEIVISVASIEHVPKNRRNNYLKELKRVGKKIILHFPVISNDGLYKGKLYDIKFQNIHKRLFGFYDQNTSEHIKSGHPTLDEIKKIFPNASYLLGRKNCDIWLKYMIFSRRSFIGFLTGLI